MHPAAGFAMLSRGGLRLLLSAPGAGPGGGGRAMPDGRVPEPGGWNRFQLEVSDLPALVETLRGRGATFRNDIVEGVGGKQILLEDPSRQPGRALRANPAGSGALRRAVRPRRGSSPAIGGGYCRHARPSGTMQSMSSLRTPLEVLDTVFGYPSFRGDQAEVIDTVVAGGDALVLMPTGGGKSLCYQVPALVRPGTGVVISPLIALMQDQVDALAALGVRAAFLNSTQSAGGTSRGRGGVLRR